MPRNGVDAIKYLGASALLGDHDALLFLADMLIAGYCTNQDRVRSTNVRRCVLGCVHHVCSKSALA